MFKKLDERGRIFKVLYKDHYAILKNDLTNIENNKFLGKHYTDKYNFLPKIYEIFTKNGKTSMIMELLYPFDYEKSKQYIEPLYHDLENFEKETGQLKLDISTSNILTRENGEIVLFDLWSEGISNLWVANTIEGNKKSLIDAFYILQYKDLIISFLIKSLDYFRDEKANISHYDINRGLEDYIGDDLPDLIFIKQLYIGLEIYKTLKEYLPTVNIDIKTYKPPLSGEGLYWEKFDEVKNKYRNVRAMDIIHAIVEKKIKNIL